MEVEYYDIVPIDEERTTDKDSIPAQIAEWNRDREKGYYTSYLMLKAQDIFKQILEDYP